MPKCKFETIVDSQRYHSILDYQLGFTRKSKNDLQRTELYQGDPHYKRVSREPHALVANVPTTLLV